jgi:nucleotide-binding universal stress UspA family protein
MKTIIIPTDFSDNASLAVNLALRINQEAPCRFVFVNVSQPEIPVNLTGQQHSEAIDNFIVVKKDELQKYIEKLGVKSSPKREIFYVVRVSPLVSESVAEIAKQYNADFIIMGTTGASGLKKVFFGSNASNTIQNSEIPVIAVPANYQGGKIQEIALATDLVNADTKIAKVIDFARLFEAKLQLVHVYPNYPEMIKLDTFPNRQFIKELREKLNYDNMELFFMHTDSENDVHRGLKEFVRVYKPDMMVMFTHKRSFWDKIFDGSRTEEVVYTTQVPLLAIKA